MTLINEKKYTRSSSWAIFVATVREVALSLNLKFRIYVFDILKPSKYTYYHIIFIMKKRNNKPYRNINLEGVFVLFGYVIFVIFGAFYPLKEIAT